MTQPLGLDAAAWLRTAIAYDIAKGETVTKRVTPHRPTQDQWHRVGFLLCKNCGQEIEPTRLGEPCPGSANGGAR